MDLLQVLNHERALLSSDKSLLTPEEEKKITEELEERLGNLHHRIHTSDYYKQEVENVSLQHNQN